MIMSMIKEGKLWCILIDPLKLLGVLVVMDHKVSGNVPGRLTAIHI